MEPGRGDVVIRLLMVCQGGRLPLVSLPLGADTRSPHVSLFEYRSGAGTVEENEHPRASLSPRR